MNREIKFRAWMDGNMYYHHSVSLSIGGQVFYLQTIADWEEDTEGAVKLMQYTGLKDKTGKEIYEGDIISDEGINGCIVFQSGCFMIEWISADVYMDPIGFDKHGRSRNYIEIIGNIYENPNLLQ